MTLLRVFRASSAPIKRQVVLTGFAVAVCAAILTAQAATEQLPAARPAEWVTPQNLITVALLIYGLGMLREQFAEVKRRLEKTEQFIEEKLPETYVQKEHILPRLRRVEANLGINGTSNYDRHDS